MKIKRFASATEIHKENGIVQLWSYSTLVAGFAPGRGVIRSATKHSRTTSKHVTQFIQRCGSPRVNEVPDDMLAEYLEA